MDKVSASVKGFAVMQLHVPCPSSFSVQEPVTHFLYIQPHAPNIPTPDTRRSLFATNVPIDATIAHFRALFSDILDGGRVERVDFASDLKSATTSNPHKFDGEPGLQLHAKTSKKRKRYKTEGPGLEPDFLMETWDRQIQRSGSNAVVVFVDRTSMENAMKQARKAAKAQRPLEWGIKDITVARKLPVLGLSRYQAHHRLRYPLATDLQLQVDAYMSSLSTHEVAALEARKRARAEPDEDGFITVTRGGGARAGPARSEEAMEKLQQLKEREEKKRREMENSGFYRFQVRERKKKEAQKLLGKFESDRQRMQEMARQRRKKHKPD